MKRSDRWEAVTLPALAAMAMQVAVWLVLVYLFDARHLGYGFFDVSDISVYREYAELFAKGRIAYVDVPFEYPPLALPLINLPTLLPGWIGYDWGFAIQMMLVCLPVATFIVATAARLWPRSDAPLVAGVVFATIVLFAGPIVANRFDIVVALLMAAFAYLLARRLWWPAAAALGLGFALKLTPALFLPLLLLLAARRRQVATSLVAFTVAAALPFLPHLLHGSDGLLFMLSYHGRRPLQIESMLASLHLLGHAFDWWQVTVSNGFGSQAIVAPGTVTLAALSPWLLGGGMLALYVWAWRRRAYLREHPDEVPLVVLTMILVLVCTSKVLSPQFLVWTFPFVALVAAGRRRGRLWLGLGMLTVTLLTQAGFPAFYWDLVALKSGPILILVLRNLVLLGVSVAAVVQMLRLAGARAPAPVPVAAQPIAEPGT